MTLGVIQYVLGGKNLGDAGLLPAPRHTRGACPWTRQAQLCGRLLIALVVVVGGGGYTGADPDLRDAGRRCRRRVLAAAASWASSAGCTCRAGGRPTERKRLYVIGVLFLAASLFWSVFEQAGSTLNLFADRNTRQQRVRLRFPEQLVPVDELVLPDPVRAGDGVGVDQDGRGRHGAVDPDQVCLGAGVRRARLRDPDPAGAGRAARWPVRCG